MAQVIIDYTNHRGERALRRIIPSTGAIRHGVTEFHPQPCWLLPAYDIDKAADRTFAMAGIHSWVEVEGAEPRRAGPPTPRQSAYDAARDPLVPPETE